MMESPSDDEIDEIVVHELKEDECCPKCGGQDYVFTGECEVKYEVDIRIDVVRKRREYYVYECTRWGERFRTGIAPGLRAECQYGPAVQASALSLMNTVNAPINKVRMFLSGLTGGQAAPCEGYIAKLQRRASSALDTFMAELRLLLVTRSIVYWDDTVIMINKTRGCLRFYGDEGIAYYTAHPHKDMDGLDDDNILSLLTSQTTTMHDHNKVNYNEKYSFQNIECNQHLQRDLQKSTDDTGHPELLELKELISKTVKDRKEQIASGAEVFGVAYTARFEEQLEDILDRAEKRTCRISTPIQGSLNRI